MSQAQHTPEPWNFIAEVGRIEDSKGDTIAFISGRARLFGTDRWTEAFANGCLIAVAPELLKALERIMDSDPIRHILGLNHRYQKDCNCPKCEIEAVIEKSRSLA